MSTDPAGVTQAERLRFRMERIRHRMDRDVDGLIENAQRMFDWKYYVQSHPFATLAAAAAAGFMIVPGTRPPAIKRVYLDAEGAKELARHNNRLIIEEQEGAAPNLFKSAGILAANTLVRAAISYVGQQLGKQVGEDTGRPRFPR